MKKMMNKKEKTKKSKKEKPKSKSVFHDKSDAGKGDVPRMGISSEEWSDRWDKIFNIGKHRKEK
jgi:hypothetical protein